MMGRQRTTVAGATSLQVPWARRGRQRGHRRILIGRSWSSHVVIILKRRGACFQPLDHTGEEIDGRDEDMLSCGFKPLSAGDVDRPIARGWINGCGFLRKMVYGE